LIARQYVACDRDFIILPVKPLVYEVFKNYLDGKISLIASYLGITRETLSRVRHKAAKKT
jgi:DNA-binding protein Fis